MDVADLAQNGLRLVLEHVGFDRGNVGFDVPFAEFDQFVVQVFSLDQEHVEPDFVGAGFFDFLNCLNVLVNALLKIFAVELFLLQEVSDFFTLAKDERKVVVDVKGLLSYVNVLLNDLFDLILGLDDNHVLLFNVPEVRLR